MGMTNKAYDTLKLIALLILPISELVGSLATVWGLPYGDKIVATLVAIDVFMGAIVKVSSDNYHRNEPTES